MSLKLPPGVYGVDKVPSPAGMKLPPGGFHAYHTIRYDARILKGTPAFAVIEDFMREYTESIGQTEYVTMTPELRP